MPIPTKRRSGHVEHGIARPTAPDVWRALSHQSFAVLSHITPNGAPRSSGVVYGTSGDRMFVVVAADSWKARHIAVDGIVAVTVPIRRGGVMSLLFPIPPATVSFPAVAVVHLPSVLDNLPDLVKLLPDERRSGCVVLEIRPTGHFVTYGLGVPLSRMRDPEASRARIPIG
ncbi:hypothetical protein HH310_39755 [Actinoplanes sp. TBRC 11911]|uniref:pyridoxamine 5'-phosphate oxidase family protein n=1 Tax=Actinoplanes sp. TBRC 11911 TaxID=2729386 RepID=UPI00145C4FC6|nr:pyridoxamine 5'-phosphate oxidase family protein [Actinoplanes sp. TBRC 11911]NMO57297.1 hypothetical protein [Actinoplanes sp. TBRC 11911]